MRIDIIKVLQFVFALSLILFGLNGFFAFLPIPEKQGFAAEFLHALHGAQYLLPTVAVIMTTTGILLLLNRWVAFGLLLQLPVSFNLLAFHFLHDWQGLIAALLIFGFNCLLIIKRYKQFKPLFIQ